MIRIIDDNLNNINELIKLSKDNKFSCFNDYIYNVDRYITFIKDNMNINHNELIVLIDLTIYNKKNKILFCKKEYEKNNNYYLKGFIDLFMFNYNKNIDFLSHFIHIKKRAFYDLANHLSNKKRIYSYFEDINNTNINFYLPIILELEKANP